MLTAMRKLIGLLLLASLLMGSGAAFGEDLRGCCMRDGPAIAWHPDTGRAPMMCCAETVNLPAQLASETGKARPLPRAGSLAEARRAFASDVSRPLEAGRSVQATECRAVIPLVMRC